MSAYRPVTTGSYAPCNFDPFGPPDYALLPPGSQLSLPPQAKVPNPFLFDRGTAQFAKAKVSWPIDMPKVKPNPPTKMSYATIQEPWAQFDLRWKAPCNVWGSTEYDAENAAKAERAEKYRKTLLTISAVSFGLVMISALRAKR